MKKQQGNIGLIVLIIVLVVAAVLWLMKSGYKLPLQTAEVPQNVTRSDFDMASKDLDNTDLNQMDSGINQINQDSTSF